LFLVPVCIVTVDTSWSQVYEVTIFDLLSIKSKFYFFVIKSNFHPILNCIFFTYKVPNYHIYLNNNVEI